MLCSNIKVKVIERSLSAKNLSGQQLISKHLSKGFFWISCLISKLYSFYCVHNSTTSTAVCLCTVSHCPHHMDRQEDVNFGMVVYSENILVKTEGQSQRSKSPHQKAYLHPAPATERCNYFDMILLSVFLSILLSGPDIHRPLGLNPSMTNRDLFAQHNPFKVELNR